MPVNAGYLYMLAALLSFGTLGVFHKLADVKKCGPANITALIYAWSVLFSFTLATWSQGRFPTPPGAVIGIAIPFGICASVAILALQAGIRHGSITTSWLVINLSSGIPTVASILIYGERVGVRRSIALALIPVSMALLWIDKRKEEAK